MRHEYAHSTFAQQALLRKFEQQGAIPAAQNRHPLLGARHTAYLKKEPCSYRYKQREQRKGLYPLSAKN
jgi:hypothetical protein